MTSRPYVHTGYSQHVRSIYLCFKADPGTNAQPAEWLQMGHLPPCQHLAFRKERMQLGLKQPHGHREQQGHNSHQQSSSRGEPPTISCPHVSHHSSVDAVRCEMKQNCTHSYMSKGAYKVNSILQHSTCFGSSCCFLFYFNS